MTIESFITRKIKGPISRIFNIQFRSKSETSKVRYLVANYCIGKGCDIGFGGDKIMKVDCDGIDFPQPYTNTGKDKVDIGCDVINNDIPVPDNTYDYVYTSHLIEDFTDTSDALKKFIRILKNDGTLILVFPDQPKYEAYCNKKNLPMNPYHIHKDMGFEFMKRKLSELQNISYQVIYSSDCEIDYNVIMVVRIIKHTL